MAKNCRIQGYMQDKSSKMKISIYTWKLAETRQFKQLQNTALQAQIDGANIWMATWLYNIVQLLGSSILDHRNSRLDPRVLRLNPRISKLEAFEPWDARIKLRVSRFKCQFTFERYCKYNSVYTWLKKHCRLRSIHHRQWGFMGIYAHWQSKFFHHKFTLSWAARVDANPWSALFKAYNWVFMQSAKKAFRSYLMFSSVC